MFNTVLKLFSNKKEMLYPVENEVTFVHHNPTCGNIGDLLCSPRHYFQLTPTLDPFFVVGGGAFVHLGQNLVRKLSMPFEHTVLWAAGQSLRSGEQPALVKTLPYAQWGTRDIDCVSEQSRFLPCVSCLHSMMDAPLSGSGTLLFLNADESVSGSDVRGRFSHMARERGWKLLLNNCTEQEMVEAIATNDHVVTNSYHGAYWSLLSGRTVSLAGYSSKFRSLLRSMDLPLENILAVPRGDSDVLMDQLSRIDCNSATFELPDSKATLAQFRRLNLLFADRLVDQGLLKSWSQKGC